MWVPEVLGSTAPTDDSDRKDHHRKFQAKDCNRKSSDQRRSLNPPLIGQMNATFSGRSFSAPIFGPLQLRSWLAERASGDGPPVATRSPAGD